MEDGPIGLSGLNAVLPVKKEVVKEAEAVTTHHLNMVERSVMVQTTKFRAAMNTIVLWKVSLS